jgi:hypothetical protein
MVIPESRFSAGERKPNLPNPGSWAAGFVMYHGGEPIEQAGNPDTDPILPVRKENLKY